MVAVLAGSAFTGVVATGAVSVRAATTIRVTTTADELNADGDCSLREAVRAANTDARVDRCAAGGGTDLIAIPPGTYTLTIAGPFEDADATGDLDITGSVELLGSGAASTILDGGGLDRVLDILAGGAVTVQGLTIRGGSIPSSPSDAAMEGCGIRVGAGVAAQLDEVRVTANQSDPEHAGAVRGGGIANRGTLTVRRSTIDHNVGLFFDGAGIWNAGNVTLVDSTIDQNSGNIGGGVSNEARLTMVASTVSGNTANNEVEFQRGGGGLDNRGDATLVNVTISGNSAAQDPRGTVQGGGIKTSGTLNVQSSTITGNRNLQETTSCSDGCEVGPDAGISGPATLRDTIVAGNSSSIGGQGVPPRIEPADCAGGIVLAGYDVVGSTCTSTVAAGSGPDIITDAPGLGPLGDNGGPVSTHALLPGSPALDAGDPNVPGRPGACPSTDARGHSRPEAARVLVEARCDAGAFERSGSEESMIQDGSFETGGPDLTPWIFRHDVAAILTADPTNAIDGSSSARVTVNRASPSAYLVQLRQEALHLRAGTTYTVAFFAKASANRTINARLQGSTAPYTTYAAHDVAVTTSWQRFAFTYTAPSDAPDAFVGFNLAQAAGDVWLDGVVVDHGNRIRNGGFETGGVGLFPWVPRDALGSSFAQDRTTASTGTSSARITVPTATDAFRVQVRIPVPTLRAGHAYLVSFAARASAARSINVRAQSATAPYPTVVESNVAITTSWARYSVEWRPSVEVITEFVGFNLGDITGTVWLDDVALIELPDPRTGPTWAGSASS